MRASRSTLHNSHQNHSNQLSEKEKQLIDSENYDMFLAKYEIDAIHAEKFDRLLLQHAGRIKPMSTYSVEVIRKIFKKGKLYDLIPHKLFWELCVFHMSGIMFQFLRLKINS